MNTQTLIPFNIERAMAGDKVVTRSGEPVELRLFNARGEKRLVGYIGVNPVIHSWLSAGDYELCRSEDIRDLFMAEPAWSLDKLPGFLPLREGEQWHRNDFTQAMLDGAYRPLLLDEIPHDGDQILSKCMGWLEMKTRVVARVTESHQRTRRPLPRIEETKGWDCPDDVPEPCWILHNDGRAMAVTEVKASGIYCGCDTFLMWSELINFKWSPTRRTPDWKPCTKIVNKCNHKNY